MTEYLIKRLGYMVIVLIGVAGFTFLISRVLPGDPIRLALGPIPSPEALEFIRKQWGLDQPLYIQFLKYLRQLVQGDLGTSYRTGRSVLADFIDHFPATLELSTISMLLALLVGIPLGLISAAKPNSPIDFGMRLFTFFGVSMPIFWLALLLMLFFGLRLNWLPISGRLDISINPPQTITGLYLIDSLLTGNWLTFKDSLIHLILPSSLLAFAILAPIARLMRSSTLIVMQEDYIRTARAKGLTERMVITIHAFKNAIIPVVTSAGLLYGQLLAGAVITETIFSWPGVGFYVTRAIRSLDYQPTISFTVVAGLSYALINLVVDLLYVAIDPRIKFK